MAGRKGPVRSSGRTAGAFHLPATVMTRGTNRRAVSAWETTRKTISPAEKPNMKLKATISTWPKSWAEPT
ncbi:MAG TPA: hypothetical protein DIC34_12415 [Treponema sp.]|nr:hypothetical protein [Treponema sp.]